MADTDAPKIYLLTPPEFDLSRFSSQLASILDAHEIACLRLSMASQDEDRIARAADVIRETAHARDVAVVIETHLELADKLGLDGVHLTDGSRSVRKARKALGPDAIVGAYCQASRHDGMTAGEAGADYVAFGPVGTTALGDGTRAEHELFEWWSEMIEVPVVAEGALDQATCNALSDVTDFFGIGQEIWRSDDPVKALSDLVSGQP